MVACLFYVVYNIHNKNVYSIEKTGGYTVREIRLKARAKINLTLDVTGKREDGYHLLETIMQDTGKYHRREDSEDRPRKCPKKKTESAKKDGEHHAGIQG